MRILKIIGSYKEYFGQKEYEFFICESVNDTFGNIIVECLNDKADAGWIFMLVPMNYVMNVFPERSTQTNIFDYLS